MLGDETKVVGNEAKSQSQEKMELRSYTENLRSRCILIGFLVVYNSLQGMLMTSTPVFFSEYTFMYPQHTRAQIGWIVSIHLAILYGGGKV